MKGMGIKGNKWIKIKDGTHTIWDDTMPSMKLFLFIFKKAELKNVRDSRGQRLPKVYGFQGWRHLFHFTDQNRQV